MAVVSSIIAAATAIGSAVVAGATAITNAALFTVGFVGGFAVSNLGLSLIASGITTAIAGKAQGGRSLGIGAISQSSPTYSFGPLQTQTSNQLVRPIIYGKVKCAGNIIWQDVEGGSTIKRIICFGDGEINTAFGENGFSNIRFNDVPVSELPGCSYTAYPGNGTQDVDTRVPGSTNLERVAVVGGLKYDAYLAITAQASQKVSGNFNVTAEIEGKKIRVYSDTINYITKYSNNPSWCILDFLTGYNGCGIPYNEIYIQSFLDAADYCDELIESSLSGNVSTTAGSDIVTGTSTKFKTEAKVGNKITIGTETKTITEITSDTSLKTDGNFTTTNTNVSAVVKQPRFTLNMILDIKQSRLDWLEALLITCRGYITYQNGKISLKIEQQENTMQVFTPDNIITGSERFWTTPREERYDIVKLQFIDPDNEYVKVYAQAEAPVFQNEQPIIQEIEAYGVTNFKQASRLAWFYLNQAITCNKYISFQTTKEGLDRTVGDVIEVTSTFLGYVRKKMRIIHMAEAQEGQIEIICKEYNGVLSAAIVTNFQTSNTNLYFASRDKSPDANNIRISYSNPGPDNPTISVMVAGTDITVILATDVNGDITSTASDVKTAIENDQSAYNLIEIVDHVYDSDGSGIVEAMIPTNLKGGSLGLYIDTIGSVEPVFDVVKLPNPLEAPPATTSVSVVENGWENKDGVHISNIDVSWEAVDNCYLSHYLITYSIDAGTTWKNAGISYDTAFRIENVKTGDTYLVGVQAVNTRQLVSDRNEADSLTIEGKDAPPPDVTGFTLTIDPRDRTKLLLTWNRVSGIPDLRGYEVREGLTWASGTSISSLLYDTERAEYEITEKRTYRFWIKSVDNSYNYSENAAYQDTEATIYPDNISNFKSYQNGEYALLTWDKIPGADIAGYEIRQGKNWQYGALIATGLTNNNYSIPVTQEKTYYYTIKAISRAGNYSETPSYTSVTISNLPPKNIIQSYDEINLQSGTHNQTIFNSNPYTWNTLIGSWDDYPSTNWNAMGSDDVLELYLDKISLEDNSGRILLETGDSLIQENGNYDLSGTYTTTEKDLNLDITARITVDFFASTSLEDETAGAILQFRIKRNGGNWTDWKDFQPVTETFRYVQFRVNISTSNSLILPKVTQFVINIDVPDTIKRGSKSVAVGGDTINYVHTYYSTPYVVASAVGAGLRAEIQTTGSSSFTVKVLDSSNNDVGGNINWQVIGY